MNVHESIISLLNRVPHFKDSQGVTLENALSYCGFDFWEANRADLCYDPRFHLSLYDAAREAADGSAPPKYPHFKARAEGWGMSAWRMKRMLTTPLAPKQKARVLIVASANTFVPVAVPIYESLLKKGAKPLVVSYETPANKTVQASLKQQDILFFPIESFVDASVAREMREGWKKLRSEWSRLKSDDEFRENFQVDGKGFWKSASEVFGYFFETRKRARETLDFYLAFKSALEKTGSRKVVVFDDATATGKACVQAVRNMQGKSFAVQHGVLTTPEISAWSSADEVMVFGEADKRFLKKAGVKNVTVVGNPKYDRLAELDTQECKRKLGLKGRVFLHTAQPLGPGYESARQAVVDAGKRFHATVVFKLHPLDNRKEYSEFEKQGVILMQDVDVFEIIKASDIVMTINSSTAVDAIAAGKPVIITNFKHWEEFWPGSKIVLRAHSEKELFSLLAKMPPENAAEKRSFIREYAFKLDGRSADRIAAKILRF